MTKREIRSQGTVTPRRRAREGGAAGIHDTAAPVLSKGAP
jgi:hypothetical protein